MGPLLSIIYPTKNRASLIKQNLYTTLNLPFKDIEVIIVDNSDNSTTEDTLKDVLDARFRFFRTGKLSMADNWDFGIKQAKGEYVVVVGDKLFFTKNGIEYLIKRITTFAPDVLTFTAYASSSKEPPFDEDGWRIVPSETIIKMILKAEVGEQGKVREFLPFGWSPVLSRNFVDVTLAKYGRVAFPWSPDSTLNFISVLTVPEIHNFRYPMLDIPKNVFGSYSAGYSAYYRGDAFVQSCKDYKAKHLDSCAYAKAKVYTPMNTVISDFFRMVSITKKNISYDDLNNIEYSKLLFKDLMIAKCRFHISINRELKSLYSFMEKNKLFAEPEIQELLNAYDTRNINPDIADKTILFNAENYVKTIWQFMGTILNRVAIFGAGAHTKWLENVLWGMKCPHITAVIDDKDEEGNMCFGLLPIKPKELILPSTEAIVISSDCINHIISMTQKCKQLFRENVRIITLYDTMTMLPLKGRKLYSYEIPYYIKSLNRCIWKLLATNNCRVAIFGAGKHTQWLEYITSDLPQPNIIALLDDAPDKTPTHFGKRAINPKDFDPTQADLIILSSDIEETIIQMRDACYKLFGNKIAFISPYINLPKGPYQKDMYYDK